jgi:hypothetical protein
VWFDFVRRARFVDGGQRGGNPQEVSGESHGL